MRISSFLLATVAVLAPVLSTAADASIPAGYYVGPGDGATTVLHVLGNGKASIGSIPVNQNASQPSQKEVISATQKGAWMGSFHRASNGHYHFTLNRPYPNTHCVHTVIPSAGGLLFRQKSGKFQMGCSFYHGASWGYTAPNHSILRPYDVKR
ncbi:hypothetical protein NRY68_11135 [Acidithiobacillus ferrooxidans]|uniref:hypothetical protein n=1 Tax=Acidithiobacillus ferrooxidans TaxID=920 RepID=UPI00214909D2|nr:hypothetical protein [Acidithiobacillus ferrooxidans]MCR1346314.1 hypothetical protein [Acidithiobacillus ferrooxidans]MCR1354407.1 hypothetical protein [Acidithiobacillus ferrooxidans]